MSELGRIRDRGENTLVPDLLGWMGAAFGDAVERAGVRSFRLGRAQMEDVIRALPAAIYTTDAAGRITFYNEAAAELWGCRPELGKSEFCGSWKLLLARWQAYAPRPMSNGASVERTAGSPRHGGGGRAARTVPLSISFPIQRPCTMPRAPSSVL